MTIRPLLIFFIALTLCSCSLLNSGTTHIKYTRSNAKLQEDIEYTNKEKFGDISFSIRNVQHPRRYGRWNLNLGLTPSIHYDKERYQARFSPSLSDSELRDLPEIQIRRLLTFANIKLTAHTPMGAFVLTGGWGLGLSERRDDGEYVHMNTREIGRIDFVWVGFFADRFYLMAGPRYYKEDYEQLVFAFRLGYFWGPISRSPQFATN